MDKYERRRLRLIELRDSRCNGKGAELARKIGRDPSYVARMTYPEGKAGKKRIAGELIDVIELAFNLPHGWLDMTACQVAESRADYEIKGLHDSEAQKIVTARFVGVIHGDESGFIEDPDLPGFSWPSGTFSYCTRIRGGFLSPRIKNGEYLIINPEKQPVSGDDALIFLKDGRKMIKELLYIRDNEVTLGSVNSIQKNTTVSLDQIEKMHRVVAIVSRGVEFQGQ